MRIFTREKPHAALKAVLVAAAMAVIACATLAGTAQTACAQVVPVRLKIGVVQLSDGDAKNIAGTPLYTGEADLPLPSFSGGNTTLSAGYQVRATNGNNLQVVPLTISETNAIPNPGQLLTGKIYYGAGLGAYIMHAKKDGFTASKTDLGGFGVVGYQLPFTGFFAELKYQLVGGTVNGARPDGLLIMIGKQL